MNEQEKTVVPGKKNKGNANGDDCPMVSVILPVFNAQHFIEETLNSVLSQTFKNFECLVIDDGSTDDSLTILRRYEASDRRVKVLSRENRGIAATRNEMISQSRGKYLAMLDHDDLCLPQRFEKQVDFLENNEDYVVVGGFVELINARNQPIRLQTLPIDHDDIDGHHLRGFCSIVQSAATIRRDAALNVGCFDPAYSGADEFDLWLRLAEIGKLHNLPEAVSKYRIHLQATSTGILQQQTQLAKRACEQTWKRRRIAGSFDALSEWRPGEDRASQHRFALSYGWTSWRSGHRATWWTYARQAICLRPFAISSWKLLIFGFLKSPQGSISSSTTALDK